MTRVIVSRKSRKAKKSRRQSTQPELKPFLDALAELLVEDVMRNNPRLTAALKNAPWRKR